MGREGRSYPALGPLGGKIAARFRVKPGMTMGYKQSPFYIQRDVQLRSLYRQVSNTVKELKFEKIS